MDSLQVTSANITIYMHTHLVDN